MIYINYMFIYLFIFFFLILFINFFYNLSIIFKMIDLKLAAEIGNQLLNEKIKIENLYKNALEKINELKEYSLTKENVDISREKEENNNQQLSQLLKSNATQDDLKAVIKELDLMNAKNYKKIEKLKEENQIYQMQIENSKSFYEEEINKYRNDWQTLSQKYKQLYNMRIDEITKITKELNIDNKNNDDLIQKLKERSIDNFGENLLGNQSQSINEENRTLTSHEYQQQIEKLKAKNKKLQSELKAAQLIRQTDNEQIELLKQKIQKYKTIIGDLQLKNDRYSHEMKSIIHKFEPNIQFSNVKKEKKEKGEEDNVNKKLDIKHKGDDMEIIEENIDADTTLEIFKDIEKTVLQDIIDFSRNKNNKEEKEVQTDPMNISIESSKLKSPSLKLISVETQTVVTLPEKIITPFSALYKRNKESNSESDKEKELSQFINIVKENNTLLPLNYYNKDKNLINIPLYHDENEKNYLNRLSLRNISLDTSIIDIIKNDTITENENLKNLENNNEEIQNIKNKENQKPNDNVENLIIDKEVPMETDNIIQTNEFNHSTKTPTTNKLNNNNSNNKEIKEKTLDNIINAYIEGKEDKKMDIDNNNNNKENEMEKITITNQESKLIETAKENNDNDQVNKKMEIKNNDLESDNKNIISNKDNKIIENDSNSNINNIDNDNTNNINDSSNNGSDNDINTVDREYNFNKYRNINNVKTLITDSNYNHTRHDRKRSSDTYLMKSYIPLYKKPRFSLNEYSRGFYNPIDTTTKEKMNNHSEPLTFHENLSNNKTRNFEETVNNKDEKKN